MKQHFTPNDLIRYIYGETSPLETIQISEALDTDPVLMEEFRELFDAFLAIPKAKFSPKPETIQNILAYSERTAPHPMP